MKTQKLIVIAAIACLLVGASGAAIAANTCPDGQLFGLIEDDVIVDGQSCYIRDADVTGNIEITNAEDVTIISTKASGNIVVKNSGVVSIVASVARNIRVRRNDVAVVVGNLANRNLRVNGNAVAGVKQNGATISIICRNNVEIDARFNNTEGTEECPAR